jgi:anti-sigma factor RsiW
MTISAEEIAAYVDGELDEAARSRVMLAALADMELADRIAAQRALRETLKAHFAPVGEAPVPDAWAQMIRQEIAPAKVVNIADARKRRFGAAPWVGMAVAASLALGVFVGARLQQGPIVERDGALVASGDLAHALDTQLASTQGDAPVQMLGTFRRSGAICAGCSQARRRRGLPVTPVTAGACSMSSPALRSRTAPIVRPAAGRPS